jgi:hypothetical protein
MPKEQDFDHLFRIYVEQIKDENNLGEVKQNGK